MIAGPRPPGDAAGIAPTVPPSSCTPTTNRSILTGSVGAIDSSRLTVRTASTPLLCTSGLTTRSTMPVLKSAKLTGHTTPSTAALARPTGTVVLSIASAAAPDGLIVPAGTGPLPETNGS